MDKKATREYLNHVIREIKDKENKSFIIRERLYPRLRKHKVIALYMALKDEVNLDDLIVRLINEKKTVVIPKMVNGGLVFYQITDIGDVSFSNDSYRIRQPLGDNEVSKDDIEIMVVPGMGFDKNNNRLGHGKGYYDKYLCEDNNIYTIGVCFEEQLLEEIPTDDSDVKLNEVITNID